MPLREPVDSEYHATHTETGELRMPYYSFDLVTGDEYKNQGSIILEDLEVASDKAEQLACELSQVRPELKAKGCAIRVTDADNRELYRTPLDPVPKWKSARR
jgi:hypothetical protein